MRPIWLAARSTPLELPRSWLSALKSLPASRCGAIRKRTLACRFHTWRSMRSPWWSPRCPTPNSSFGTYWPAKSSRNCLNKKKARKMVGLLWLVRCVKITYWSPDLPTFANFFSLSTCRFAPKVISSLRECWTLKAVLKCGIFDALKPRSMSCHWPLDPSAWSSKTTTCSLAWWTIPSKLSTLTCRRFHIKHSVSR